MLHPRGSIRLLVHLMNRIYLGAIGCTRGGRDLETSEEAALSPEEIRRAASLRHLPARRRFVAGRWLARTMLSGLMDVPGPMIPISISSGGRPVLEEGGAWSFSISHSGDIAVCAVSDIPVGVDVERVASRHAMMDIAREFFHPREAKAVAERLAVQGADQAAELFTAYWTLKEAHLKRRGEKVWGMKDTPEFSLARAPGKVFRENGPAWYCLGIPSSALPPFPYLVAVSAGEDGEGVSLSRVELHLRFLLAGDPPPRVLFRSESAGPPGGRE